jgi:hypothetical protein
MSCREAGRYMYCSNVWSGLDCVEELCMCAEERDWGKEKR